MWSLRSIVCPDQWGSLKMRLYGNWQVSDESVFVSVLVINEYDEVSADFRIIWVATELHEIPVTEMCLSFSEVSDPLRWPSISGQPKQGIQKSDVLPNTAGRSPKKLFLYSSTRT